MRRAPQALTRRVTAGYPRLASAWRVLASAAPLLLSPAALADSSVPTVRTTASPHPPPMPGQMPAPRLVDAAPPNDPKPNEPPTDANRNPKPKPRELPKLMGKIACPRKTPSDGLSAEPAEKPAPAVEAKPKEYPRPKGDIARARRPAAPWVLLAGAEVAPGSYVIHPHGPDEPCHELEDHEVDA